LSRGEITRDEMSVHRCNKTKYINIIFFRDTLCPL